MQFIFQMKAFIIQIRFPKNEWNYLIQLKKLFSYTVLYFILCKKKKKNSQPQQLMKKKKIAI